MSSLTRSLARRTRPAPRGLHLEALERREVLYAPVGGGVCRNDLREE